MRWLLAIILGLIGFQSSGCLDVSPHRPDEQQTVPVVKAFRVLVVEEGQDRSKYTRQQLSLLISPKVRSYIDTHAVKGSDGKTSEFRLLDKDRLPEIGEPWKSAVTKHPPQNYPWLYVTNGVKGFSGPLPSSSSDDFIGFLKSYAE